MCPTSPCRPGLGPDDVWPHRIQPTRRLDLPNHLLQGHIGDIPRIQPSLLLLKQSRHIVAGRRLELRVLHLDPGVRGLENVKNLCGEPCPRRWPRLRSLPCELPQLPFPNPRHLLRQQLLGQLPSPLARWLAPPRGLPPVLGPRPALLSASRRELWAMVPRPGCRQQSVRPHHPGPVGVTPISSRAMIVRALRESSSGTAHVRHTVDSNSRVPSDATKRPYGSTGRARSRLFAQRHMAFNQSIEPPNYPGRFPR